MTVLKSEPVVTIKPFSDVYISTGNGRIKDVLKRGFDELGGIEKFIHPGQSVMVKPNLVTGQEAITGGVSDVRLCEALVELIKENCRPGRIMCGENTDTGSVTMQAFIRNGYVDMCKRQEIELVDFTVSEFVDVPVENAMYAEVISVPREILEADVFITLPVLKNHDTVCVTAAVKNSFGLVKDDTRRQAHRDNAIEQYLVDIARVRKPDFSIVDGRIGMEGIAGGNYFDRPRYANRIIMGADPVAVDVICAHIMEQNPRVRYLQWADQFGIGNCNLDYINVFGIPLEEAKVPFMTPAQQIEETTGNKFHLIDLGSCSRCRAVAQGTLHRFFSPESVLKKVDIVYGSGNWDVPADRAENCLLLGDCIQERYRSLGTWIPGCPMKREDYFNALNSMNIVCSKCEDAVKELIANHTPEELAFVRILASNKTVFQGADNKGGATDFLLAVGACQSRYVRHHIHRSNAELEEKNPGNNVDAAYFVKFITGHNPSLDELEDALQELMAKAAAWKAK